ncbi:MAG: leucine-rich repeat domain-containing protein [Ruminococcaceae bacterium]|nr:leucine-rich repeat domain-containing protein [Oscillospiraceae bacterium]
MKNKKILKSAIAFLLIAVVAFSFSACGGTPKASDANGTAGTLNWSYTSNDQTLTISGSGDIPSSASADDVSWANVRQSVVTIKFVGSAETGGITSIGDYAFYYMPNLKTVEIPASVTTIGKSAFAFCEKLENITIPANVANIGERAFEGCSALKAIVLPTSVTALGQSAFAYCNSLTDVSILGSVSLPAYAFRNCKSLSNLNVSEGVTADATAFDGAAKTLDNSNAIGTEGTITVKYVLEDGTTNAFEPSQDRSEVKPLGEAYSYASPEKEGYIPDQTVVSGVSAGLNREIIVKYMKNAEETAAETQAETQAPAETEAPADNEKEGVTASTIIAIVIMGVVIVAIIVGAVLLMRSDKNNRSKGKNNSDKNKK